MEEHEHEEEDLIEEADLTPMMEMAVATHELYECFMEAGFKENQALWLCIAIDSHFPPPYGLEIEAVFDEDDEDEY